MLSNEAAWHVAPRGMTLGSPRLLNVNNYHYRRGGAETVYLGHGAMFAEAGWGVDWFSMKHPLNPPGTDETYFAELIDLEHMPGTLAKARASAAILYNRQAARRLARLLDARRPDILHAHNIYHHLSPSILAVARRRGVPVVLTAHDLKLACPSYTMLSHGRVCERCKGGKVWNLARHRCLKGSLPLSALVTVESAMHKALGLHRHNIDRIVAPSLFYRAKLIEWGWSPDRIVHIPNFVATDMAPERGAAGTAPLLYFGRLSEEKGLATLIRAATLAGTPVRIAGTGPSEAALRTLAASINAPVEFVGHQPPSTLATMIAAAPAVVLPSEWYENAPMSVMEAFQLATPAIGTDIGGIPELIKDGETGWLFPPGDVAALADRLAAALAISPARLATMGAAAADFVGTEFSRSKYLGRMLTLYAELSVR